MIAPWLDAQVTCDWPCHAARHISDLGDDFGVAQGTAIPAPFDGTVRYQIRQEQPVLYIAYITSDANPAVQVEFMHLSRFGAAGHHTAGQTLGWSGGRKGAVGSGRASGPHLHVNAIVNGRLTPIRDILSEFSSVGPVTPVTAPSLIGKKMRLLPQDETKTYFLEVEGAGIYTVPDQAHADMIFRYLNNTASMSRADIDGVAAFVAGPPTYKSFWQPASSGGFAPDLSGIVAGIASLQKLESTDEAATLAAIASAQAAVIAKQPTKITATLS